MVFGVPEDIAAALIEALGLVLASGSLLFSVYHAVRAVRERALARRLTELSDLAGEVSTADLLLAHGITADIGDVPDEAVRYLLRTLYIREAYHLTARGLFKGLKTESFTEESQMWHLCRTPLFDRLWKPVLQPMLGANRSGSERKRNSLSDRIDKTRTVAPERTNHGSPRGESSDSTEERP